MIELRKALADEQAQGVACGYDETVGLCTSNPCCYQAQPTEAQQVAVPVPMTDDEAKNLLKTSDLLDMFENIGWYSAPRKGFNEHALSLIRATEARHKIGAKPATQQVAVPASDFEVSRLYHASSDYFDFARKLEAHHGIGARP